MINYDTKCPFIPCPSQTPSKYRPCFIKFYIKIKVSWFVLFFLSGQYPQRLQWAILVIISYYFLFLPYFVNKSDHYFGFTFKFYCDLVFVCFASFFVYFPYFTIGLWAIYFCKILFKQLIVFLCSFFFFKSLVDEEI